MPFTVTAVDPLYLKIPDLSAKLGSGQQDSLLIRISTGAQRGRPNMQAPHSTFPTRIVMVLYQRRA